MEKGVRRWAVDIRDWEATDEELAFCLSLLPPGETLAVNRYVHVADRKRALISRLLQRKVAHDVLGIPWDKIQIGRTREGKPFLATPGVNTPFPCFNFNVSHHGDYVLLASDPARLVGVDVMTHSPGHRPPQPAADIFRSFQACYTPYEWAVMMKGGPSEEGLLDQFYRYWCMKEAYIKAVGIGLGFELKRAEFHYVPEEDIHSRKAAVFIDGVKRPEWNFCLHRLGDHWVEGRVFERIDAQACVARGPPEEAISSYRDTLAINRGQTFAEQPEEAEVEFELLAFKNILPEEDKQLWQASRQLEP